VGLGNGSQVNAGQLPASPQIQSGATMFMIAGDTGGSNIAGDALFTAGRNFGSAVSASALVPPGADILHELQNGTTGSAQGWVGLTNGTYTGGVVTGVKWSRVKLFASKFTPVVDGTPSPTLALFRPVWFCGLVTDVGQAGLRTGLATVNSNNVPVNNWMSLIASCGFYFDPAFSPNYQLVTSNGSGGFNQIDSGVQPTQTLTDLLQFTFDGSTVKFYVNGSLVGIVTSNLPPANNGMCFEARTGNTGTAGTTVNHFRWGFSSCNFQ
jgi:hypothetical protein